MLFDKNLGEMKCLKDDNIIFDDENYDAVNEAVVAYNEKDKLALHVTIADNQNYGNLAYFKVTEKSSFNRSKKLIRICYKAPAWIDHREGKELYILNQKLKEKLYKMLTSTGIEHDTVWKDLISEHNRQASIYGNEINLLPLDLPIPNYTIGNWPCVSGRSRQIKIEKVLNGEWDYTKNKGM